MEEVMSVLFLGTRLERLVVGLGVGREWTKEIGRETLGRENSDEMEMDRDSDVVDVDDVVVDGGKKKRKKKREMRRSGASKRQRQCLRNCWIGSGRR